MTVPPPPPPAGHRTPEEREVIKMVRWLLIVVFVVLAWLVLSYAARVLAPILAALGIAYLLTPVLDRITRRGVPRSIGALIILIMFVLVVIGLITLFAPMIAHQVAVFVRDLPRMIDNLSRWAHETFGVEIPSDWKQYVSSDEVKNMVGDATGPLREIAAAAVGGALGVLGVLAEMLLVPVFAFYFLVDWPNITRRTIRIVPPRQRARTLDLLHEIDDVVSGWVRGQATVTAILAVLYAIAFSVVGMPLAIPIGLIVGVLTVIPFVGTIVGAVIALGITLADQPELTKLLQVAGIFGVLHVLEAAILTPKIVGHRVGLGESAALFAVVAGGKLLGFVGILLAVPIAATVAVLLRHAVRAYEHSEFFGSEADAIVPVTPGMAMVMPEAAVAVPTSAVPQPIDDDKEKP